MSEPSEIDIEKIRQRLEYLRGELRAGQISYGELFELDNLVEFIEPDDVELLEAAGVPEFPDDENPYTVDMYPPADPVEVWRRWNGYPELLAALKAQAEYLDFVADKLNEANLDAGIRKYGARHYLHQFCHGAGYRAEEARAAIAKAEGRV